MPGPMGGRTRGGCSKPGSHTKQGVATGQVVHVDAYRRPRPRRADHRQGIPHREGVGAVRGAARRRRRPGRECNRPSPRAEHRNRDWPAWPGHPQGWMPAWRRWFRSVWRRWTGRCAHRRRRGRQYWPPAACCAGCQDMHAEQAGQHGGQQHPTGGRLPPLPLPLGQPHETSVPSSRSDSRRKGIQSRVLPTNLKYRTTAADTRRCRPLVQRPVTPVTSRVPGLAPMFARVRVGSAGPGA
jgi:hypothetical protein